MLKIAHLSDLHITSGDFDRLGFDALERTRRAMDHILETFPEIDFLAITGDLTNWGEAESYARLRPLIDAFPRPVRLMIGNHDHRQNFLAAFGEREDFVTPYAQYRIDQHGHRMLFLDSVTENTHGGAFGARRLDWVESEIASAPQPVLIFMHHHPVASGAPAFDAKGLADGEAFAALLARYPGRVRHIFHGHCHATLHGQVLGVSFSGVRSVGIQAGTDLKSDRACRWYGAPQYAIAVITGQAIVTHQVDFLHEGPVFYRDKQVFADFADQCASRGVTVPSSPPEMLEDL